MMAPGIAKAGPGRRRMLMVIAYTLLSLVSLYLLAALLVVLAGMDDELHTADVAIIPGNTVNPDGRPSPRLQARLDKAIELYHLGYFRNIIVSGATGAEGFNEPVVMMEYLRSHAIPQELIHIDSSGNTTYGTARNAAAFMHGRGWRSAIVVTQYFHVPRTRLALERSGVEPVYSAHADFFELRDLYSTAREVIGLCAYYFKSYD